MDYLCAIIIIATCFLQGYEFALNPNILIEKSILDTLFTDYDKRVRPGSGKMANLSENDPAIVTINMYLRSISKINDVSMEYSIQVTFREEWNDERLKFDNRGKIPYINLPTMENIWQPDLFFANEKHGHFHDILIRNLLLRVYPNGNILYSVRISLLLSCPMSLEYYPLDRQRCYIEMVSYAYTTKDIIFVWKEINPIQIIKNLHLPSFTLERTHTSYCTSKTNTGDYSCLRVELLLRREFSYYLLQLYIPSFMLVIVSWVSFWLDQDSVPARASLGVTTLLTMATQSSGINAKLPPVSYTKAIDIWIGSCLTFIFGALLEFALVNYVGRKEAIMRKRAAEKAAKNGTLQSKVIQNNGVLETGPRPGDKMIGNGSQIVQVWNENDEEQNEVDGDVCECGAPLSNRDHKKLDGVARYDDIVRQRNDRILSVNASAETLRTSCFDGSYNKPLLLESGPNDLTYPVIPYSSVIPPPPQQYRDYESKIRKKSRIPTSFSNVYIPDLDMNDLTSQNYSKRFIEKGKPKIKGCCHSFMRKYKSRSKRIDVLARVFFPLAFTGFNIVYWVAYMI